MADSLIRTDGELLGSFDQKLQVIRDRVRGVAEGYHTAAYLTGRPGTSKTYTVKEELEQMTAPSVMRNARMTPMGLFEFLYEHPEHVVVLDDIATLFKDRAALQILMAALDGDPMKPRKVNYKSKDKDLEFHFSGGIVAISNLPLANDPLANAVSSRVVLLEHEPTDEELAAFMRKLAHDGYKDLSVEQCQEVVAFVVEETRTCDRRLDLRHLTKAYEDRRQWEDGLSETPWQELVRTWLEEAADTGHSDEERRDRPTAEARGRSDGSLSVRRERADQVHRHEEVHVLQQEEGTTPRRMRPPLEIWNSRFPFRCRL